MTFNSAHIGQFLDQVFGEIEAGRAEAGVLLLAGLLDAAQPGSPEVAALRKLLAAHPLRRYLDAEPRSPALSAALAQLGFIRGLSTRSALSASAIEHAWQQGKWIALLDCGEADELVRLSGRNLDDLLAAHRDAGATTRLRQSCGPSLRIADPAPDVLGKDCFDLIVATGWPDRLPAEALAEQLTALTGNLAPAGRLLLSSFVPGHLGWGWQTICLGRDLHCHDEVALARCASHAGLAATQFRDPSGSLIWAELRTQTPSTTGEPLWISQLA